MRRGSIVSGLREGTAAEAGLLPARLDRLRDLASGWVNEGIYPALVALVARRGVIALHEAYGRLGPEPDAPIMTCDALFPLASLGKPITATACMMLVEDGVVGLTRPVREYLPEFTGNGKDAVCVHHLLTHTSGIAGPTLGTDEFAEIFTGLIEPPADPALHPIVERLLLFAYERPLRMPPGQEMFYDTINYDLLGEIIQRVSGQPLGHFLQDRIFVPLGMTDTYLPIPDHEAHRLVRANAEGVLAFAWNASLATIPSGGGGGCSTARDMAVLGQTFLDGGIGPSGRILAPSTVQAMVTNQIPGVPGVLAAVLERHNEASWGYGWGIASHEKWDSYFTHPPGTFSHAGATGTYLWCDPNSENVGAFFAPMARTRDDGWPLSRGDLFVNVVTAATDD
jgi:CubicO group peptidase (beta-lactamase class C family)